jgi:transcriptional regulator with XRE-family HTH domain
MTSGQRGVAYPLWERVEEERVLRGWSATQLAHKAEVARSTIHRWQTQPVPPQPGSVNAVADVLGIDRMEALQLAGILTRGPAVIEPECTFEREILASTEISDQAKADLVAAHRLNGHDGCRPLADPRAESAPAQALR